MLIAFVLCSCLWNAQWSESEIKYYLSTIYLSIYLLWNIEYCSLHRVLGLLQKHYTFIIEFELHSLPIGIDIIGMHVSSVFSPSDESLTWRIVILEQHKMHSFEEISKVPWQHRNSSS